ncbi:MAG: TonB family protein [Pseudomonadota bacterium]
MMAAAQPTQPAPVETEQAEEKSEKVMIGWEAGEIICSSVPVTPVNLYRPMSDVIDRPKSEIFPVIYTFEIDATGRTFGIRRISEKRRRSRDQDIAPSLAASQFPAGTAHSDCTVIYRPQTSEFSETELSDLMLYSIMPLSVSLPKEGSDRVYGTGNCYDDPRPQPQRRLFPDFRTMTKTKGDRDWVMIAYDIDGSGRTTNVTLLSGTQNAVLEEAGLEAVEGSRYYDGGRQGCRYHYWLGAETIPPPQAPGEDDYRPDDATCPVNHRWTTKPALRYPKAYNRRSIEGWAFITYDITESGELENIAIADSQPTEDFGFQASLLMRNAKAITDEAVTGCVLKTRFRIPKK